jgi:hypothetical protein
VIDALMDSLIAHWLIDRLIDNLGISDSVQERSCPCYLFVAVVQQEECRLSHNPVMGDRIFGSPSEYRMLRCGSCPAVPMLSDDGWRTVPKRKILTSPRERTLLKATINAANKERKF